MSTDTLLLLGLVAVFTALVCFLVLKLLESKKITKLNFEHKLHIQNLESTFINEQNVFKSSIKEFELKLSYLQKINDEKTSNYSEKLLAQEESKLQMKKEFQLLSNKIFEQSSTKSNQNFTLVLKPFKEQLEGFNKRVNEIYNDESIQRSSLLNEIKNLKELNNKISNDANNLTKALKGENKTQGDWGEMILAKLLESCSLSEGKEFFTQNSYTTKEGKRLRPDVVISLPNKKDIIIDSKVSLVSYARYQECEILEDKKIYKKDLEKSILNHIKDLSSKKYEDLPNLSSLDFVILFIPIEAAFILATQDDSKLLETAYEHNVMLVSTSSLFVCLRTIENLWRYEHQNENAKLIATKAGHLYDKFALFVSDIEDIGNHIKKTQNSYESALNKLRSGKGNLLKRSEEFLELGVKSKKIISIKSK